MAWITVFFVLITSILGLSQPQVTPPCGIWGMPCPTGPCGGFTCGSNAQCSEQNQCECLPGYERPCTDKETATISCSDIDECRGRLNRCPVSQSRCENTPGSYRCVQYCKAGYRNLGSGVPGATLICRDVDECASHHRNDCAETASCENTLGSFRCTCRPGYSGNGIECQDIDECSGANQCHSDASCVNTEGGYRCQCNNGFVGNGFQCRSSRLRDPCLRANLCQPEADCFATRGSYICRCREGYSGDGVTECRDIDECASQEACAENAVCTNTPGGFQCACAVGFIGDGYKNCTAVPLSCEENDFCLPIAECITNLNDDTSWCLCPVGFSGDGIHNCTDVDECEVLDPSACGADRLCNNTIGSFICTCLGEDCGEVRIGSTEISENDRTLEYVGIGLGILGSLTAAVVLGYLIRRKRRPPSPLYVEETGEDNPAVDTEGVTIEPVPASASTPVNAAAPNASSVNTIPSAPPSESVDQIVPTTTDQLLQAPITNDNPSIVANSLSETPTSELAADGGDNLSTSRAPSAPLDNLRTDSANPSVGASNPSVSDATLPVIDEIEVWNGPSRV